MAGCNKLVRLDPTEGDQAETRGASGPRVFGGEVSRKKTWMVYKEKDHSDMTVAILIIGLSDRHASYFLLVKTFKSLVF